MDWGGGGLGRGSEHLDQRRWESRASDFPEPTAQTSLELSCAVAVSLGKMGPPLFAWGCGAEPQDLSGRETAPSVPPAKMP